MTAAQLGDDRAYEQLMREVGEWLLRFFQKRLPSGSAEDAAQEALLAIHIQKHRYRPDGPMTPWLKTIARFKWVDQVRSYVRSPDRLADDEAIVGDHGDAARAVILLDILLDEVKPAQAQVIRMVKIHGASVDEAARLSGQTRALVKVNIHRGLKRIGRVLSDQA